MMKRTRLAKETYPALVLATLFLSWGATSFGANAPSGEPRFHRSFLADRQATVCQRAETASDAISKCVSHSATDNGVSVQKPAEGVVAE
jgi:hypothetical protein